MRSEKGRCREGFERLPFLKVFETRLFNPPVGLTVLVFDDIFMQIFATTKVCLCHAVKDLLDSSASADTG